jgi:hypothetical protein
MSLHEEIQSIIADSSMSYEDKREKLLHYLTPQEVRAMLPEPIEEIRLKEPLQPKREGMRILNLSVVNPIFESILTGGHVESRDYNDYFKDRCTYVENGVRYLIPFDAITFYVGRGSKAKKATVAIKDIKCDGSVIYFYMGEVIRCNMK